MAGVPHGARFLAPGTSPGPWLFSTPEARTSNSPSSSVDAPTSGAVALRPRHLGPLAKSEPKRSCISSQGFHAPPCPPARNRRITAVTRAAAAAARPRIPRASALEHHHQPALLRLRLALALAEEVGLVGAAAPRAAVRAAAVHAADEADRARPRALMPERREEGAARPRARPQRRERVVRHRLWRGGAGSRGERGGGGGASDDHQVAARGMERDRREGVAAK